MAKGGKGAIGYACHKCMGVFETIEEVRWKKVYDDEEQKYICEDCLNLLLEEHKVDGDVSCDIHTPHKTGEVRKIDKVNLL